MSNSFKDIDPAIIDTLTNDNDLHSLESLAWRLLTDEDVDAGQLMAFNEESIDDEDPVTFIFELLINLYMEMVTGEAKLGYLINLHQNDKDLNLDDFTIDLSDITEDNLIGSYREKMLKIGYFLKIHQEPDEIDNYYCRVLLKDSPKDQGYFYANRDRLDKDKRFHFVLNACYEKRDKLDDVYAICNIGKYMYKISFEKFTMQ